MILIRRFLHMLPVFLLLSTVALADEMPDKLAVPDDADQKEAAALIANLFKSDFDAAKSPEQRSRLAKKLLQVGNDSKDDLTGRYVLLLIARDVAAEAGDVTTTIAALKALATHYDVDVLALDAEALEKIVKALTLPKDHQELASLLQSIFHGAIARDRFDIARRINAIALDSARKARSAELVKRVAANGKEIELLESEFQQVQVALATLKTSPTDPDANLLVGQYQCFVKRDWDNGLLMLVLGSDDKLKSLATLELAEGHKSLDLGNAWWDYSKGAEGKAMDAARIRAAVWYKQALVGLEGLSRKLVESRLEEVVSDRNTAVTNQPDKTAQARYAVQFDGTRSFAVIPSFKYTGTHPLTVEAFTRANDLKVSFPIGDSTGKNGFTFQIDRTSWIFSVGTGADWTHLFAGGIEKGEWVHIAGVLDGTKASLFLNGKLRQTKSLNAPFVPANAPLTLGGRQINKKTWFFAGAIREMRISKTARYTATFEVPKRLEPDADTLIFLPFTEGKGNLAADASGNKHHATLDTCGWLPPEYIGD